MFEGFQNITRVPELKRRILVTGLLLIVYRIGIHTVSYTHLTLPTNREV